MSQRPQPSQNGRDQPAHQGAVAIGQRFQSGMRCGTFELVVEGSLLVQYAVENVRRDSPCREAGYLGWLREFQWRHGIGTSQRGTDEGSTGIGAIHRGGMAFLAPEDAQSKNPPYIPIVPIRTVGLT